MNFGLEIPYCTNDILNAMVHYLLDEAETNDKWNYLRPRGDRTPQGGIEEFYRITDFCRNPQETTQAASAQQGDPTPVNLQGYNHMAKLPFQAFLNTAGISERYDISLGGTYYEVNMQVVNSLTIAFYNAVGDDLHLQDFIDLNRTGDVLWRPVLQIFCGYINLNSDNPQDRLPWYQRDNLGSYDSEVAGGAITSDPNGSWSVTIDLTDSKFTPFINVNEMFHLCVGVGCVNPSFTSWKDNNESLFILPYTDQQFEDVDFPFYYRFKLVSYMARKLNVTAMQYYRDGLVRWDNAGGTPPYFEIEYNATGALRLTMTITKLETQSVDFVGENGSAQTSGAVAMKVQAREWITGNTSETTLWLTPANSSWQTAQYINVPTGSPSETTTLYATLNVNTIPIGGYGEYHLYANTGGTNWDNIGYFSIHRLS